jgi:hypothetical protein
VSLHGTIQVSSRRALEGDRLVKRMTLTHLESGRTREAMESLRLYEPGEMRAMARDCGLELLREAGDYQGAPFLETGSARWIGFLARPRSDKMD